MRSKKPFARFGRSLALVAVALSLPAPALAGSTVSGEVALSSQLVDRGVAITHPVPALQGAVGWVWPSGWSLSLSGGIELHDPDHLADGQIQLSRYWTTSTDWRLQARLLYYHYSGLAHAGFYEAGVDWIYRDILTVGLSEIYSPGNNLRPRPAADLDFHWPLERDFSLEAGIGLASYRPSGYGHYAYYSASYYRYGHLGLLWNRGPWQLKLDRLLLTHANRMSRATPAPWLATLSRVF